MSCTGLWFDSLIVEVDKLTYHIEHSVMGEDEHVFDE